MSEKKEEFLTQCKTLTVEQLEHLLRKGGLTKEQELICKTEINTILDRKKYDTDKEGAPEIITKQESGTISSDYKASTGVAMFVSFSGWVVCVIALIFVVVSLIQSGRMGILAVAPGLGLLVGGLILVMLGQVTRAALNNANYTKQMLDIMRKKT